MIDDVPEPITIMPLACPCCDGTGRVEIESWRWYGDDRCLECCGTGQVDEPIVLVERDDDLEQIGDFL